MPITIPPLSLPTPRLLPDYADGPLGLREYRGQIYAGCPLPAASGRNVLLVNSGGDCRGYNNIGGGAYRELRRRGYEVFGALNGPASLTNPRPQILKLTDELMEGIDQEDELLLATGGRGRGPFDAIPGLPSDGAMANFLVNVAPFLGGLLFAGGNGTARMVERLFRETDIKKVVFAGASMDGDIPGMERTVGLASALDYAVEAVQSLRITSGSCNKIHVVQTMGGSSGRFPLEVAIASGQDAFIVPEMGEVPLRKIYEKLFQSLLKNRGAILIIGEKGSYRTNKGKKITYTPQKGLSNAKVVQRLANTVKKEMNQLAQEHYPLFSVDTRVTILGHVQRQPQRLSNTDVRLGIDTGIRMALALNEGHFGTMIPFYANHPPVSLTEALSDESVHRAEESVRQLWLRHFGGF